MGCCDGDGCGTGGGNYDHQKYRNVWARAKQRNKVREDGTYLIPTSDPELPEVKKALRHLRMCPNPVCKIFRSEVERTVVEQ